jgi:hypothetical protein
MSDPLSITLAAVTLATALKDIIELAQKIEGSFAKVSSPLHDGNVSQNLLFPFRRFLRNLQTAQRLSKDVLHTLFQLQEFCDQNCEVLNASVEMNTALMELMG